MTHLYPAVMASTHLVQRRNASTAPWDMSAGLEEPFQRCALVALGQTSAKLSALSANSVRSVHYSQATNFTPFYLVLKASISKLAPSKDSLRSASSVLLDMNVKIPLPYP